MSDHPAGLRVYSTRDTAAQFEQLNADAYNLPASQPARFDSPTFRFVLSSPGTRVFKILGQPPTHPCFPLEKQIDDVR